MYMCWHILKTMEKVSQDHNRLPLISWWYTHITAEICHACVLLHMFTQADLLIVNHDHSYIDYDCAMCFWEHMEMFVIVSGAAIWVYATTNYPTTRASDR